MYVYCVTLHLGGKQRHTAYIATVHSTIVAPDGMSARYEIKSPVTEAPKPMGIDSSTILP